jgi:hypothetical protein
MSIIMRSVKYTKHWAYAGRGQKTEGNLADLVLDIPYLMPWGVIPPLHVLNEHLLTGGDTGGMSPGTKWKPFQVTEQEYAELVDYLLHLNVDEARKHHPISMPNPSSSMSSSTDVTIISRGSKQHRTNIDHSQIGSKNKASVLPKPIAESLAQTSHLSIRNQRYERGRNNAGCHYKTLQAPHPKRLRPNKALQLTASRARSCLF